MHLCLQVSIGYMLFLIIVSSQSVTHTTNKVHSRLNEIRRHPQGLLSEIDA